MAKDKKQNREGGRAVSPSASKKSKRVPKAKRKQKWAMSRDERKANRRGVVLRAIVCVVSLVLTLFLALVVGDSEYQPTPIGWVPFVTICVAIILSFAYVMVLKRSLKLLEKTAAKDCRRNEKVKFTVRFRNTAPLFYFRIEPHFFTADGNGVTISHATTTLPLAPFEHYDMDFNATFEHLGVYQAGLERVVVWDFLRLFSVTLPGPKRCTVQVAPRIVPVTGIEFSYNAAVETTKALRSTISDSMDYAAVREYAIGDPMKNVHWKLSARSANDELFTKIFEVYTNPGVAVVIDLFAAGVTTMELREIFDAVVEAGFSVARYAQTQGMDAEVRYVDKLGETKCLRAWREADLPALVSEMPQVSSEPARAIEAITLLKRIIDAPDGQSNIVVCTANLTGQMLETVRMAKVQHREPQVVAVVPKGLEGRERDQWLAPLATLDAAGIPYVVIEDSDDLSKSGRRR